MSPVALITGGTRGIGLGIAQALLEVGYDLALCGVRSRDSVDEAIHTLEQARPGATISYHAADVAEPADRTGLIEAVQTAHGRLNLLVNNAGVAPSERRDLLEASEASYERVMKINLQGPYFLTQLAARWMIEQKRQHSEFSGCIINVSSISATVASVNRGEYCLSKAGIAMATRLWATRLAEFGISVYEIRPGIIQTDMTVAVQEKYDRLIEGGLTLQPRWGLPSDVGKAVVALATGRFPYSTGATFLIDGGLTVPRL